MASKCVIILNNNNLSGFLNNNSTGQRLRIDFGQLLEACSGGRECLGAFVVSQNDTTCVVDAEKRKMARRFLYTLRAFNWTPLEIEFKGKSEGIPAIVDGVYQAVYNLLMDSDGQALYDLNDVDIVFITGSSTWISVIKPFADVGMSIEVVYPECSTSAAVRSNYSFIDLTDFIYESSRQVAERRMASVGTNNNSN